MDNQQRRLQSQLNLEGLNLATLHLHKKYLPSETLRKEFITSLHTISREEMVAKFNIPNMSIFNAIVLKLYAAYTYLPIPKGYTVAQLYGTSNYAVSQDGIVFTIKTRKLVTPYTDEYGYLRVNTRHTKPSGKVAIYERLHRLLGMTFYPLSVAFNTMEINHKNGNKQDNSLTNLEWLTQKANLDHAWNTGLRSVQHGEKNGSSKLTATQVLEIRKLAATTSLLRKDIASKFNIASTTVYDIVSEKTWKHLL